MKYKTRFAPSPTGNLHLGGVRTALFNWLFARANGGDFILRIEDTDIARSTKESTQGILESLKWLGLDWDGDPYFQTERLDIYFDCIAKLSETDFIYPAFETKEELELMKQKSIADKKPFIYRDCSLKLSKVEAQKKMDAGCEYVWRFNSNKFAEIDVPEQLMAKGSYKVKAASLGDFIITRPGTRVNPGMPLYNFVCAVDDVLMGITHVIRGVEHLPNAAKQVMIQQALGYTPPLFFHLPLIMKNGKKMSKREKDANYQFPVSVDQRRELGYLPDATINQVALLGWSSADSNELFDLNKLKTIFDIKRFSKANANFDEERYLFLNAHYMKTMNDNNLFNLVKPFLFSKKINISRFNEEKLAKIIALEKSRVSLLADFPDAIDYFFEFPIESISRVLTGGSSLKNIEVIQTAIKFLEQAPDFSIEKIDNILKLIIQQLQLKFSDVGPILRMALSGKTKTPALSHIIHILDKEETLRRLKDVRDLLEIFSSEVKKIA